MNYHNVLPSNLLENAVNEFSKLPGIGRKTALRMALYIMKMDKTEVESFGRSFIEMKQLLKLCEECNNISDTELCSICSDASRDKEIVCIVEDIRDVISIENTGQYFGTYHILGGIISPINGIGPADLSIDLLENRVKSKKIKEIILALSTTMEGDTTNFYVYKRLKNYPIEITTIARGVSFGDELEYTDELTLGRSIKNRVTFENTLSV